MLASTYNPKGYSPDKIKISNKKFSLHTLLTSNPTNFIPSFPRYLVGNPALGINANK
jgi:hypothetical protein